MDSIEYKYLALELRTDFRSGRVPESRYTYSVFETGPTRNPNVVKLLNFK